MTHDLGYLIGGAWLLGISAALCLPAALAAFRPTPKRAKVRRHD